MCAGCADTVRPSMRVVVGSRVVFSSVTFRFVRLVQQLVENELPDWHPLLTGDKSAMHNAGHSMKARTVAEFDVPAEDQEDYVIEDL